MGVHLIILLMLPLSTTPLSLPDPTALFPGQSQYQEQALKASLPNYGSSWLSALSTLYFTCSQLSSNTQARLTFQLKNCFLAQEVSLSPGCRQSGRALRSISETGNLTEHGWVGWDLFMAEMQGNGKHLG